jgi:hypothetical protein
LNQWLDLFRALGQSLADLAAAEIAALKEELARNGRTLGLALALFGAAAVIGVWLIALVLFTLIQVLAIWLPMWGASAVVTGVFLIVVTVLALVGAMKLKKLESPAATVGRRWSGHRRWWDRHLLADTPAPAVLGAAADDVCDDEEPDGGLP